MLFFTELTSQSHAPAQMVAHTGTCGAHVSPTTVQATWRKQTVQFARKLMHIGAVDRPLGQYSSGTHTAMRRRCLLFPDPHFQVIPLSIPLDQAGGTCMYSV